MEKETPQFRPQKPNERAEDSAPQRGIEAPTPRSHRILRSVLRQGSSIGAADRGTIPSRTKRESMFRSGKAPSPTAHWIPRSNRTDRTRSSDHHSRAASPGLSSAGTRPTRKWDRCARCRSRPARPIPARYSREHGTRSGRLREFDCARR